MGVENSTKPKNPCRDPCKRFSCDIQKCLVETPGSAVMSFFGFGQTADIEIAFDDADKRKVADIKTDDGKKEKYLLYYDGETVSGRVNVTLRKPGAKLEHQGIKVELIGQIELFYDRGNHHEFISLVKELARPGDLLQHTSYTFEFANVEKPYEVYTGSNVRLRYFLRATIIRRLTDIVKEVDIAVHTLCSYPDVLSSIKMEVGIEDCLHIEFEYNKSKYHLKDVIVGKIYFLLVRIKIKHMEISIIKRETTGSGPNTFTENETVAKYEIMDGAPVRGESIPIRVFLAGYELTPTMRDINNKFSVRYYLNLVLMDTEDRRYFKQQEVTLWRKSDKSRLPLPSPHNPQYLVGVTPESQAPATAPRPQSVSPATSEPSESSNPLAVNNHDDSDREMIDKRKKKDVSEEVTNKFEAATIDEKPQAESKPAAEKSPAPVGNSTSEKSKSEKQAVPKKPTIAEKPAPVAEKASPIAEKPTPIAEKVSQKAEKASPVAEKASPKVEKASPLAEKASPVAEKPRSEAEKPSKIAEKLSTVVETPTLVAEKLEREENFTEKPSPVAEKPVVAEKPKLVTEKPAPVSEKLPVQNLEDEDQ